MHKASEQHSDKNFSWMCTESAFLPLCTQRSFEARWWNFSHIKAICKDFPLPPLFCRISPVYSTPFTRWLTPLSTIPPAAARLCGSSCLWPLTPASGGGAARRVQQVTLASTQWVAVEREKRAFWGPPLKLPSVSTPRDVFVVMQKGVCCRPVRALFLTVSVSLHLSHSIGFNFNDGGVTELREESPSLSAFKNSERTLKRCAEAFW